MLWWRRYAWIYFMGGAILGGIIVLVQGVTVFEILRNSIFWIPSPMLIFAYCKKRLLLNQLFWRFYFFFLLFDTIYDIWQVKWFSLVNFISIEHFSFLDLVFNAIEIILFLPAFYVHFIYAFRPGEISKK